MTKNEFALAYSLIAAQKLQTPETLAYVRDMEASYLTLNFGLSFTKKGKVRRG